ncbi:hypothetical protein PV10_08101 [Exophiala mesophila]|uniref:Ig-like domain-containing protein n=1 Tax=Exophiala mesophila TaxID=212818 RepID=A0A0D1WHX1_EXOME|nr:uncharacterized protein PV10_08101 [Exophiala mesophila]KIV88415.1 hypothetical protein PV10_08101 [Exophiala mesophila]
MKSLPLIVVIAIAHLFLVTARLPDVTGPGSFNPLPIKSKQTNNGLFLPALSHLTTPTWPVITNSHLLARHANIHVGIPVLPESEEPAQSTMTTTVLNLTTTTTVYVNSTTSSSSAVIPSETDPLGVVFGTVTNTQEPSIPAAMTTLEANNTDTPEVVTVIGTDTDTDTDADIMTMGPETETEAATTTFADPPAETTAGPVLTTTYPEDPITTAAKSSSSQIDDAFGYNSSLSSSSELFEVTTAVGTSTNNNSMEVAQSTTPTSCVSSGLVTMVTPLTVNDNDTSTPAFTTSSTDSSSHVSSHHTTSHHTTSTTTNTLIATATADSNAGSRSLSQPPRLFRVLSRVFMLLQVNLNLSPTARQLVQATHVDGDGSSSIEPVETGEGAPALDSAATTTISMTSSTTSTTTTTLTYTSTTSLNTTSTIDMPTLPCTANVYADPAVPVTCTASSSTYNGTLTFAYGHDNGTGAIYSTGGIVSHNASSILSTGVATSLSPASFTSSSPSSSTSHRSHATPSVVSGASGLGSWSSRSTVFDHRMTPFMVHMAIVLVRLWNRHH